MLLSALRRRADARRAGGIVRRYAGPDALARFRDAAPLPPRYGVGMDERCVALPWALAHLPDAPGRLLDVGAALGAAPVRAHPALAAYAVRSVADVQALAPALAVESGPSDVAVCLSGLHRLPDDAAAVDAMRALRRALRPGGVLLVTVPFGIPARHDGVRVFDRHAVVAACAAFGAATRPEVTFYEYRREGWQLGSPATAGGLHYAAPPHDGGLWGDGALGARAVACVRLTA